MSAAPKADPADLEPILAAVRRLDRAGAMALAATALGRGVWHPLVLLLAAEEREEAGADAAALALLERAVDAWPDEAEAWRRLGALLAKLGKLEGAAAAYEESLDIAPDIYLTLLAAGAANFSMGDLGRAEELYRRAAARSPLEAEPVAALAALAARREDAGAARALAARALTRKPSSLTAHMALARADLLDGQPAAAEARMDRLLADPGPPPGARAGLLDLRAEARDALDRTAEAFADYGARNRLLAEINRAAVAAEFPEGRLAQARRLADALAAAPAEPWRRPPGPDDLEERDAPGGHAFLLSFPRSGSTLLEKALAGHPGLVTLEEVDCLSPIAAPFLADAAGLARLAELTRDHAAAARRAYWAAVRASVGGDLAGRTLVDKLPLHTLALPVIGRLFPGARILFAVRDPRDVVLSCFRRRFRINASMYELLTLEGAADFYDATMRVAEACRRLLPLKLREMRHETLVTDFAGEMEGALAFLGVHWEPAVAGFAERARERPRTPSDPQVARGLNAAGIGQWRRYARELAPVLPVLAPWVDRFGYPAA